MKSILTISIFILAAFTVSSQNSGKLDSLKILFEKEKTDTGKIVLSYRIAYELQYSDPEQSLTIATKALEDSKKLKFPKGTGNSLIQLGNLEQIKGNNEKAEEYNLKALEILSRADEKEGVAICYNNLGIIAHNGNDYTKATEFYRKSLDINRQINRKSGEATALYCLGTVNENQAKYDSALKYYLNAQTISELISDSRLIAYGKISLANVYFMMDNYSMSMKYNEEAIGLYEKAGNYWGLLKVYTSLGQTAERIDSTSLAIWFYNQAMKITREIESPNDEANICFSLGQLYENSNRLDSAKILYQKANKNYRLVDSKENVALSLVALARLANYNYDFSRSKELLKEAKAITEEIKSPRTEVDIFREMSMTYSGLKDFRTAFYYLNRYSDLKDSLMTVEKQRQILELQTQYETDKKEKENELLRKDRKILQTTRNSLIIGALLLVIIIVVVFRSLTVKKRDNRALKEQRDEINRQKEIVETQKTAITDSIRYAKRIQSAMLPPEDIVNQSFPDSFLLYLPRDIVSGDFYWIKKLDEKRIIICVADCTGHGVPGAFMSMLGMSLLNNIISVNHTLIISNKFKPSDILNELRERIKGSLRQTGKDGEARDGMDLSLCIIDREAGVIKYSGANNPIYIVNNGMLTELKATRNPIGIYLNEISFTDQSSEAVPGSMVYLFSDGYSDQIGSGGSKFLSKNFKKMLAEISNNPALEIRQIIHKKHLDWRAGEEQVDDILVLGFRI
jgi:serine phosphatase RsbU (regulator of sigma subunit)/tetratricopeptide (TPR) repeat protein